MFDKQREMMKALKPAIEDINRILGPKLVEAFEAGYQLGLKQEVK